MSRGTGARSTERTSRIRRGVASSLALLLSSCGGAAHPRPTELDTRRWCRGPLVVEAIAERTERECVEHRSSRDVARHHEDLIGDVVEPCLRWVERRVPMTPGEWWNVTGCGETVPYWCGHVCGAPEVRCIPEGDVGMTYCATF